MTLQAEPSESALKWRRPPVTDAELIEARQALPVVATEGSVDAVG